MNWLFEWDQNSNYRNTGLNLALTKRTRKPTQVNLSFVFRLATYLRRLAIMTCVDFGRAQIRTQVDASFSLFGHPTQVDTNISQVNYMYVKLRFFNLFFCNLREHASLLENPFGHPSKVRICKLTCFATYIDLRVRFSSGLNMWTTKWTERSLAFLSITFESNFYVRFPNKPTLCESPSFTDAPVIWNPRTLQPGYGEGWFTQWVWKPVKFPDTGAKMLSEVPALGYSAVQTVCVESAVTAFLSPHQT